MKRFLLFLCIAIVFFPTKQVHASGEPQTFQNAYIQDRTDAVLLKIHQPKANDAEKVRAAYQYLIETVCFDTPLGLDIWRYRAPDSAIPDYVENRALSPLVFGIGSCEDYAAAMVLLCRRMGLPAKYVAGLTLSVDGIFVDHAWASVCVENVWYHVDPQLEDNVLKGNRLTYRFFLRGDAYMLADHRWGANLVAYYGSPSNENTQEILQKWTPPACPQNYTTPPPLLVRPLPRPARGALEVQLEQERKDFVIEHGALPALVLDITPPPVFLTAQDAEQPK